MLNKVMLIGNLGDDPAVCYTSAGDAVTNISLATTQKWRDKQSCEKKEKTEWHRVVFFRRLAEVAGEYLRKGSQVYIEGHIQTRKWQDQSGQDRYSTEIIAEEMQMLGSRSGGTANLSSNQQTPNNSAQSQPTHQQNTANSNNPPHVKFLTKKWDLPYL